MLIAIVNNSTLVNDVDVATMQNAINNQLWLHFLPAWRISNVRCQFYPKGQVAPDWAWTIAIIDSNASVVTNPLGGKDTEFVIVDQILNNGGAVMVQDPTNPHQYTVSGTLSRKILKLILNRFDVTYCDDGYTSYALDACTPVEDVSYGIVINGVEVTVSDFVFESFFNSKATVANAPFSYMNSVSTPFTLSVGGSVVIRIGGPGTETLLFGANVPQWRRDVEAAELGFDNQRKFARLAPAPAITMIDTVSVV
jgi:hypothetical protein